MAESDYNIILIGLNHHTAEVDIREQFALADNCEDNGWALPNFLPITESMILSTCNRVEILAVGKGDFANHMMKCWANARNADLYDLSRYIYKYYNLDAVKHLFSVASSLDSMIIGEPQILGQLKSAYKRAVLGKHTGQILNRLLHKAFYVAKRVRSETAVASNAVSISYAAVEMAKRIFGDMHSHKALLIGAGEMAELAANHLLKAGINDLYIANRTLANGVKLAQKIHGKAIAFEKIISEMCNADIVITSTGSPEPIISAKTVKDILKLRRNRPMFFIDIAVPRDIDPDVNELDNIYLYDIDDLKDVVEENMTGRRSEAEKADTIITEEVDSFSRWLYELNFRPAIMQLIERGNKIADDEVKKTMKHFGRSNNPDIEKYMKIMARSIISKMNHAPLAFIKQQSSIGTDKNSDIELIKKIFNIN